MTFAVSDRSPLTLCVNSFLIFTFALLLPDLTTLSLAESDVLVPYLIQIPLTVPEIKGCLQPARTYMRKLWITIEGCLATYQLSWR